MASLSLSCPVCKKPFTIDSNFSGQKLACPSCGQRIQVPEVPKPSDKTMLAVENPGFELLPDTPPPFIPPDKPPPFRRQHCRICGSMRHPYVHKEIGTTGIAMIIILLVLFFPLFWIGLLIKDEFLVCPDCGNKRLRYMN